MWKSCLILLALLLGAFPGALQGFQQGSQQGSQQAGTAAPPPEAKIPPEAANQVNPVHPTAQSQARAKQIYTYDCALCHGQDGSGKGDVVADAKVKMLDYREPSALKGLTDGEIFYIIKNGRGEMPAEGPRATPVETWNLVIYLRSLSKQPHARAAAGGPA